MDVKKLRNFIIVLFALAVWVSNTQKIDNKIPSAVICDIPSNDAALTLARYDFAIVDYLNAGGTHAELESLLIDRELIGHRIQSEDNIPVPHWARNRGGVYVKDVDQNGYLDVIVAFGFTEASFTEESGGMYIFGCQGNHYVVLAELTKQDLCSDNCDVDLYTPRITFVGDMNQDGYSEIVYDLAWSGITTLWMDIRIGSWSQRTGRLIQLNRDNIAYPANCCCLSQVERELPAGTYEVLDTNDDGLLELLVQIGCSGSGFAAGPQRSVQLIFEWNDTHYVQTGYLPDPPRYHLHAAYDAVYALNQFETRKALSLYDRVLTDESLDDSSNHDIGWIVTSHALYGKLLSTIALYGNSSDQAIETYHYVFQVAERDELLDTLWMTLASLLWKTVNDTGDLDAACEMVNNALSIAISDAPPYLYGLNVIGYWPQFGYNMNWVPTERNLSMCPF